MALVAPATNWVIKLEQEAAAPAVKAPLPKPDPLSEEAINCPLCLDLLANAQTLFPCGHCICGSCLEEISKKARTACLECTTLIQSHSPARIVDLAVTSYLEAKNDEKGLLDIAERRAEWKPAKRGTQDGFNLQRNIENRHAAEREHDRQRLRSTLDQLTRYQRNFDAEQAAHKFALTNLARVQRVMERQHGEAVQLATAVATLKLERQQKEEIRIQEIVGYVPGRSRMGVFAFYDGRRWISVCSGGYLINLAGIMTTMQNPRALWTCESNDFFNMQSTICQGGPHCPSMHANKRFEIPLDLVSSLFGPPRMTRQPPCTEFHPQLILANAADCVRHLYSTVTYVTYPPVASVKIRLALARKVVLYPVPTPEAYFPPLSLYLAWTRKLYPEAAHKLAVPPKEGEAYGSKIDELSIAPSA